MPRDVTEREVEKLASEFGRIRDIRTLNGFAFVEFSDSRDARDCVHDLHGIRYDGERLICEPANSRDRKAGGRDGERGPRGGPYRLKVDNIPPRTSWQVNHN